MWHLCTHTHTQTEREIYFVRGYKSTCQVASAVSRNCISLAVRQWIKLWAIKNTVSH